MDSTNKLIATMECRDSDGRLVDNLMASLFPGELEFRVYKLHPKARPAHPSPLLMYERAGPFPCQLTADGFASNADDITLKRPVGNYAIVLMPAGEHNVKKAFAFWRYEVTR